MNLARYKRALVIFVIYVIVFILMGTSSLIEPMGGEQLSPIIPGDNWGIELFFLFGLFVPLAAVIGTIVLGYVFVPIFLFFHKKFIGAKTEYGIQNIEKDQRFSRTFQGFFPSLMAINLSLIFSSDPGLISVIVTPRPFPEITAFIIIIMGTLMISLALFSAVWILFDAGIVNTNRREKKDLNEPLEIKAVGGFYLHLLKGYSGIGAIFAFYTFFITAFQEAAELGTALSMLLLLLPFPILISIACIPAMVLMDATLKHRKEYTLKLAKKMGIVDFLDIKIEKIGKV